MNRREIIALLAGAAHQTFRMLDEFIQDAFNKKL